MTARKKPDDMQLAPIEGTIEESRALTAPTPDNLLALALERNADMDQLERLMALKERHDANEARKYYVAALAAFKAEPIELRKTKAVGYETTAGDFVGYKHATLADVVDAVVAAMARHGLSHNWSVKQEQGITVTCTLTHAMGHSESVSMTAAPDNSGKKNAIQQVASTVTYLQRYTLQAITGVAAKDMDDDGTSSDKGEGAEGEPTLAEATLVDWETAIGECETIAQLAGMRSDMIKKLGGGDIEQVPQRLRSAAMRQAEKLAQVQ